MECCGTENVVLDDDPALGVAPGGKENGDEVTPREACGEVAG